MQFGTHLFHAPVLCCGFLLALRSQKSAFHTRCVLESFPEPEWHPQGHGLCWAGVCSSARVTPSRAASFQPQPEEQGKMLSIQ